MGLFVAGSDCWEHKSTQSQSCGFGLLKVRGHGRLCSTPSFPSWPEFGTSTRQDPQGALGRLLRRRGGGVLHKGTLAQRALTAQGANTPRPMTPGLEPGPSGRHHLSSCRSSVGPHISLGPWSMLPASPDTPLAALPFGARAAVTG